MPFQYSGTAAVKHYLKFSVGNKKQSSKRKIKQETKVTSASRSLYTLAITIIKFKNTKNDIPNTIR